MAATAVVRIEAPGRLEDELVAELWRLGCDGSWSEPASAPERIRLHAFFAATRLPAPSALAARLARSGVDLAPAEIVPDRDWLADWRRTAQPIPVGERFLVDPREPDEVGEPAAMPGRWLLRLPARTAFGIGSHESTALAVELLESLELAGARVLDVGAGTGILALAALHLGASSALAFDIDPAAALLLRSAGRWNDARLSAFAGTVAALRPSAERPIDVALVNVVPAEIEGDLPLLYELVRPGGQAIFSGILDLETDRAARSCAEAGFRETRRARTGEWVALLTERSS